MRIQDLHIELNRHLVEISKHFKSHIKLTLIARNPEIPTGQGDVICSNDDFDLIKAAIDNSQKNRDIKVFGADDIDIGQRP